MEYPEITVEYLKSNLEYASDATDEQLEELVNLIDRGESEGREAVEEALEYFSEIFHMHGVESIKGYPTSPADSSYYAPTRDQTVNLVYANAGDSYAETLAYDTQQEQFLITSWGDWVENIEQEEGEGWEEEAWNDWIKSDLNKYLPDEVRDYFEYDADEELADRVLWNAYQKAKSESGEYPVYESGGAYLDTEKMGSIYAQIVKDLLEEEGIEIEKEDVEDEDLQQEEFNRQFNKSYDDYLNEQDQMRKDLINEEAFSKSDSSFSVVKHKLENRYSVYFEEERGDSKIYVEDNYSDKEVWNVTNDTDISSTDSDDEDSQEESNMGLIDQLIEDGFIKWENSTSVLEYLYSVGVIEDFDTYQIVEGEGQEVPVVASSESREEAFDQYCLLRDQNPDKKYYVFELATDITEEFEEECQEESEE